MWIKNIFSKPAPKPEIPTYMTDFSWSQDSDQSIVDSTGRYDMKRFSKHESDTIIHVLNVVNRKYPREYRALGLANESYPIKYKPRYVLYEIIVLTYGDSDSPYEQFAVALAYQSKGAYFRKEALRYFEECEKHISADLLKKFISFMPLYTYTTFADLYKQEHDFEKAIYYTRLAKKYAEPGNPVFDQRIKDYQEKMTMGVKKRNMKMSKQQAEFEDSVTEAALKFIKYF